MRRFEPICKLDAAALDASMRTGNKPRASSIAIASRSLTAVKVPLVRVPVLAMAVYANSGTVTSIADCRLQIADCRLQIFRPHGVLSPRRNSTLCGVQARNEDAYNLVGLIH